MTRQIIDMTARELVDYFFEIRNTENHTELGHRFSKDGMTVFAFGRQGEPMIYETSALVAHIIPWLTKCQEWFEISRINDDSQPPLA